MKLSTRVRFGVRIMVQVAAEDVNGPVFARRIAGAQGISEAYVDQILMPLRAGGLLRSVRGRNGGYQLARSAESISVLDIVETLEGVLSLVECVDNEKACDRIAGCVTHLVWRQCSVLLRDTLSGISLEHLKQEQLRLLEATHYVI